MTDVDETIIRRARIGIEVAAFAASDAGRYLFACAHADATAALDELLRLAVADPANAVAISAAGHKVMRLNDFEGWVKQAIDDGTEAEIEADHIDGNRPID